MDEKINYIRTNILSPFNAAVSLKSNAYNQGDMSDNDVQNKTNREMLFNDLEISGRKVIHNRQVHSSIIINSDMDETGDADGVITSNHCQAPYILTADCFNIFFKTDNDRQFGIVHAGWKGIIEGIVEELALLLKGDSSVLIAHGICSEHFMVDYEVMKLFSERFTEEQISLQEGKFHIDLRKIIENILIEKAEIYHLHLCNICSSDLLFSYRNGDEKQRNMSIIWR